MQNKILSEGLVNRGHAVCVFSPKRDFSEEIYLLNGVKYIFYDAKYENRGVLESLLNIGVKNQAYKKSLEAFLTEHTKKKFDIVISQSSAGLGIIRNKNKLNLKVLTIAHGTIFSEFKTRAKKFNSLKEVILILKDFEYAVRTFVTTQKEFLTKSDVVVCVSNFVRSNVIKETGIPESRVLVIFNGVKAFTFDVSKRDLMTTRVLYVGRIDREKGVFELVDVFCELLQGSKHKLVLDVVGGGKDLAALREYVNTKKTFKRNFNIYGLIDHNNLGQFYNRASIFVLPTKRIEGFPVTLPEAMLAHLPIISFRQGGVGEAVIDTKTGFLVKEGDFPLFRDRLKTLIDDEKLRNMLGENSFSLAVTNFTEEKMVDSYEKLIFNLLSSIIKI
ncbi:MAG: glycosyltransferase family 4 protein [Patescibacteria group bacterium]